LEAHTKLTTIDVINEKNGIPCTRKKDFEKLVQWFDEQDDFTLIIIDFQILK
jgi:hypothetical protein